MNDIIHHHPRPNSCIQHLQQQQQQEEGLLRTSFEIQQYNEKFSNSVLSFLAGVDSFIISTSRCLYYFFGIGPSAKSPAGYSPSSFRHSRKYFSDHCPFSHTASSWGNS
jgi:hypothetical protein